MTSSLLSRLAAFPRYPLLDGPTPLQRLTRLEAKLGLTGVRLFAKRDDHIPVGGGGNKMRKLEYLLGDALAQGTDTFITVGARQSNHARQSAAAAAHAGLACELVLARAVPRDDIDYVTGGNVLLDRLFGATLHDLPATSDPLAFAEARAAALRAQGRRVYVAPSGGSSPVGCLAYAQGAAEIVDQAAARGISSAQVVVANGSSGTHAGLAAGFAALASPAWSVKSHTVLAPLEQAREITLAKARATGALLGVEVTEKDIAIGGAHRGEGYGIPTGEMREAVRLMARTEGLLLDPVYSGKAFAGLLSELRQGRYTRGQDIVFLMTGGTPALFAYRVEFTEGQL